MKFICWQGFSKNIFLVIFLYLLVTHTGGTIFSAGFADELPTHNAPSGCARAFCLVGRGAP
jgi:hypothetical protein